ncbi:hypothetical protein GCM10017608_24230 [Agromyces luteolus]|uniref:DUF1294 domain-containing protein n=1 Tax=Agromyces luteolus TaxID=88373 RepID=A0A7C9LT11_9MICO|nr:DUF1294 domain-containing protein [Agromyces luteolus]MUN07236.1 DUF1294 domain-containing protein [Agromyces luteolus]GLK28489.1 hypothetical protein GCM10017608_24230 [Agromyces luteolus]
MRPEPTAARRAPRAAARTPRTPMRPGRDLSRPLPAGLSWGVLAAFAGAVAVGVLVGAVPWWLAAWYGAASLVAFTAYGADKAAAQRSAPRVAEQTLHLVDLAGGWPGAIVAQQLFRHKTRKRSFRRSFWGTVVVNALLAAGLVALLGSPGVVPGGILDLVGR